MSASLAITSFGFIDENGFGGKSTRRSWDRDKGDPRGQLRWRLVSEAPHDRFGRLDLLSKYVTVATEMLGLPRLDKNALRLDTAVVMGTIFGCQGVDLEFYRGILRGEGPSPSLFAYTLPSIAVGEITIRHRLGGPSYCYMVGPDSDLLAIWEGIKLLKDEGLKSCICLAADVFPAEAGIIARKLNLIGREVKGHAYAFLVEQRGFAKEQGRSPLAEVAIAPVAGAVKSGGTAASRQNAARLNRFLMAGSAGQQGKIEFAAPPALGLDEILIITRCRE